MNKTIDIRILKNFDSYNADQIITVDADGDGIPRSEMWRRRINDAKLDQCCEIVKKKHKEIKK